MLHSLGKAIHRLEKKFDDRTETDTDMKELLNKIYWALAETQRNCVLSKNPALGGSKVLPRRGYCVFTWGVGGALRSRLEH